MRALVVGLVLVGAVGVPARVRAESVDEQLPFLADEAPFPVGVPSRLVWPDRFGLPRRAPDDEDTRPVDLPPASPAYPDVSELLAPVIDSLTIDHGVVRVPEAGADRERALRLLRATRAAYARDLHVELDVHRGDERLLSLRRTTRAGALLLDDDRSDSTWPAALDAGPLLIIPESITVRTGARVGIVVDLLPDGRTIVDLDVHVAAVRGERTFDDPAVRRVAPEVEVCHVRAAVAVTADGVAAITFGALRVEVRVRRDPERTVPGTRQFDLPQPTAWLQRAVRARPRRLPLVFERELEWQEQPSFSSVPEDWLRAARDLDVRLVAVPPDRVIAEGNEGKLEELVAAVAAPPTTAAREVRDTREGLSLPVVVGRPFTILDAVLIPAATRTDAEIQTARAIVATRIGFEAVGSAVHGAWDGAALELTMDARAVRELVGMDPAPRSRNFGGAPTGLAVDALRLESESRTERVQGESESGASLAPLEGWR